MSSGQNYDVINGLKMQTGTRIIYYYGDLYLLPVDGNILVEIFAWLVTKESLNTCKMVF